MNSLLTSPLLQLAWPEIFVIVAALAAMAVDLLFLRAASAKTRFSMGACVASIGCIAAIVSLLHASGQINIGGGMLLGNPTIRLVQLVILAVTILALLLSVESTFTKHIGEYILLVLLATTGMLFLVASQDLLVIFASLELFSLSLYILTGFDKTSPRSSEAALKYFLFGAMSAAFLLFGFSLLYGFSNSTSLPAIANAIHGSALSPFVLLAIVTTMIGFGFKVAAAPFHFWAPDVYQGAPAPSAAFIASGSKIASAFIFFQIMVIGFAGAEGSLTYTHLTSGWVPVMILVAIASMLLGNLVAIVQTSLRRLLAYSAVAHAGYMLLAIVAHTQQSLGALIYYVATYAFSTLGAFSIISVLERQTGNDNIVSLHGFSRRAPFLSACLAVFFLSLAGIPPLSGFFGKFYLFIAVIAAAPGSRVMIALVILAIAMSAVSLYYYLRVLKAAYVTDASPNAEPIHASLWMQFLIGLLAAGVVLLGCAPHLLLKPILAAVGGPGL